MEVLGIEFMKNVPHTYCFWCKTLSPCQEHVVHYVVKLLASPAPHSHSGTRSLLVDNMSMLSAVLGGASCVDTVHILSLHGVVSESHIQFIWYLIAVWIWYPILILYHKYMRIKEFRFTWQLAAIEFENSRPYLVPGICSQFKPFNFVKQFC